MGFPGVGSQANGGAGRSRRSPAGADSLLKPGIWSGAADQQAPLSGLLRVACVRSSLPGSLCTELQEPSCKYQQLG